MTELLVKLFVKNPDDVSSVAGRQKYGQFASIVGIVCNAFLFAIKLIAGILSSSVSVMADAFNNLSDFGSCVVTMLGFKLASKPADKEHPFGHGRMEYMSGFIVAVVIIIVGFELLKSSISKIITPEEISANYITIIVLVLSILVKLWMGLFNGRIGKKIDSASMKAAATDSISDVISTLAVLIAIVISLLTGINIDGYIGLLVAGIIMFSGFKVAKETLDPLLGLPPEKEFVDAIYEKVMSRDMIVGIHDMIVHDYGPGRCYVSLHAEVPADKDINDIHEIIDECEQELAKEFNIEVVIHMDPVEVNNEVVKTTKKLVAEVVKSIDERFTIHDFRMVSGVNHTNLIFDVVKTHDCKMTNNELIDEINKRVSQKNDKFFCVINVDTDYARIN